MNLNQIFSPLFAMLWWLIPLLVFIVLLKSPFFKGWLGETLVRWWARHGLNEKIYTAFHNVTLPTPDGTTQIDHVFVSCYGIFVVETKNYAGWIFGGENQPTWTQKIYRNTNKFQNPLRQNHKHIKALEAALDLPAEVFHSVIVFAGGATFKTPMPPQVCYGGEFIRYIRSKSQRVLSDDQVSEASRAIAFGRLKPGLATHREHVRNVENRLDPSAPRRCPKCGSPMVVRTAKTGASAGSQFWGCSQFPRCRVSQPM